MNDVLSKTANSHTYWGSPALLYMDILDDTGYRFSLISV